MEKKSHDLMLKEHSSQWGSGLCLMQGFTWSGPLKYVSRATPYHLLYFRCLFFLLISSEFYSLVFTEQKSVNLVQTVILLLTVFYIMSLIHKPGVRSLVRNTDFTPH